MGYTHYWGRSSETSDDRWAAAVSDAEAIIAANSDSITDESTEFVIRFNGNEESCEDFIMQREKDRLLRFEFCKTRGLPYDDVVTAVLCVFAEAGLDVSSDGNRPEWRQGQLLAMEALQRPVYIPSGIQGLD